MQLKCAWCGKDMGENVDSDVSISHGICPDCSDKWRSELAEKKFENSPCVIKPRGLL